MSSPSWTTTGLSDPSYTYLQMLCTAAIELVPYRVEDSATLVERWPQIRATVPPVDWVHRHLYSLGFLHHMHRISYRWLMTLLPHTLIKDSETMNQVWCVDKAEVPQSKTGCRQLRRTLFIFCSMKVHSHHLCHLCLMQHLWLPSVKEILLSVTLWSVCGPRVQCKFILLVLSRMFLRPQKHLRTGQIRRMNSGLIPFTQDGGFSQKKLVNNLDCFKLIHILKAISSH